MSGAYDPRNLKQAIRKSIDSRGDGPPACKVNTKRGVIGRDARVAEWPDFQERRMAAVVRRQEVVVDLERLHDTLREKWEENGVIFHDAIDASDARTRILQIIKSTGAKKLLKGKSMLGEEIELNAFLEEQGIQPVETDLGEYIVQLRNEPPSHITMPGMHLTRKDVGRLFEEKLGVEYTEDPPTLTRIARKTLRSEFLSAEVGLVGVNFAVAETGHICTVTNEGNGRMVTSVPRVVIAIMGYERVTQSMADLAELYQLLTRSATGQRASVYLNFMAGPAQGGTGPEEVHVVVVDNGRKKLLEDKKLRDVLRCIRCGACLNVCPVYQQVGGHPFGGTYPGPIGSVLTPALFGLKTAPHHAFASSLCGACKEICPMDIALPDYLLELRRRVIISKGVINPEASAWKLFRTVMMNRRFYDNLGGLARNIQKLSLLEGRIHWPPGNIKRLMPVPARFSFNEMQRKRAENAGKEE